MTVHSQHAALICIGLLPLSLLSTPNRNDTSRTIFSKKLESHSPLLISVASKQPGLNRVLNTTWTTQRGTRTPQVRGAHVPLLLWGLELGCRVRPAGLPWHLDYTIELLIRFVLAVSDASFWAILASLTISPLKVGLLLSCTSSVSIRLGKVLSQHGPQYFL